MQITGCVSWQHEEKILHISLHLHLNPLKVLAYYLFSSCKYLRAFLACFRLDLSLEPSQNHYQLIKSPVEN